MEIKKIFWVSLVFLLLVIPASGGLIGPQKCNNNYPTCPGEDEGPPHSTFCQNASWTTCCADPDMTVCCEKDLIYHDYYCCVQGYEPIGGRCMPVLPTPPPIGQTIGNINILLYGIAAGIAALLIAIHGLRWKTATSPEDRREAKRGIWNVIIGLLVVIIAVSLVELIYGPPPPIPPAPGIVVLDAHCGTPASDKFRFWFKVKNTGSVTLTDVVASATAIGYVNCKDPYDESYSMDLKNIDTGKTALYSHDNFCLRTTKFEITVSCNEGGVIYCAECPPIFIVGHTEDCTISEGWC